MGYPDIPTYSQPIRQIEPAILIRIKKQLERDLQKCGVELGRQDVSDLTVDQLLEVVQNLLEQLSTGKADFWQLLYIIDLPEKLLKEKWDELSDDQYKGLAKLILIREWQKVEIRRQFPTH